MKIKHTTPIPVVGVNLLAPLANSNYRKLWVAQLLSEMGDWASRLAVSVLVFERTQSPAISALTIAVSMLPWVGIGPFLATYGDRYPRHVIMVIADIVRAALFVLLAVTELPVFAMLIVLFLAGLAAPPFGAARASLLPDILGEKLYKSGLGLAQITQNLGMVAGYAMGGIIIAAVSAKGALLVNAATYIVSALLLYGLRYVRAKAGHAVAITRLRQGWNAVWHDRDIRTAALLVAVGHAGAAAVESLVVPIASQYIGSASQNIGYLAASGALGTIIGSVWLSRGSVIGLAAAVRQAAWIIVGMSIVAMMLFGWGVQFITLVLAFFAVGAVFSTIVPLNAAIGMKVSGELRASMFGVLQSLLFLTHALTIGIFGVVAGYISLRQAVLYALSLPLVFVAFILVRKRND